MMNQVTVAIITPTPPPNPPHPSPFILPAILPLADFNDDVIISLSHPPARPPAHFLSFHSNWRPGIDFN